MRKSLIDCSFMMLSFCLIVIPPVSVRFFMSLDISNIKEVGFIYPATVIRINHWNSQPNINEDSNSKI